MASETRTGGRAATEAVIGGDLAIAVGRPQKQPPTGFAWRALNDLARLETGHTPSRRHPEYWNGDVPWIGIRDATGNHGRTIASTLQTVTQAGIDNSSARVLPEGTVCLSRTASVGYVVVMGRPMATSQDFVNWVCGPDLDPRYLKYVLQSDRDTLLRFANGSTHQTIYFPEVKAFHALLPSVKMQREIAANLGALDDKIESNRRQIATANALADTLWETIAVAATIRLSIDELTSDGSLQLSDGYRTRVDQLGEPGVPILRVADVADDHFAVRPDADHVSDTYRSKYREKVSVAGDVLVTTKGTVGRTAPWAQMTFRPCTPRNSASSGHSTAKSYRRRRFTDGSAATTSGRRRSRSNIRPTWPLT